MSGLYYQNGYFCLQTVPKELQDLLAQCLSINPRDRPTPSQLLTHPYLQAEKTELLSISLERKHPLLERSLKELYYLWRLAGGDVQAELRKQGLIRTKPPILSLPMYVFC